MNQNPRNRPCHGAIKLDPTVVAVGVHGILLLLRFFEAVLFAPADPAPTLLRGEEVVDGTDPNLGELTVFRGSAQGFNSTHKDE